MSVGVVLTEHIDTVEKPQPILIQPGFHPPRTGDYFGRIATYKDVPHITASIAESEFLALDLETRGSDYSYESIGIVGLGLAWDAGNCYLPWADLYKNTRSRILDAIYSHPGLIAHNIYFDGGVLYRQLQCHPSWRACTYALLAQCSNEGWVGQQHGLKTAMVDILGWPTSNESDLDEWLVTHGFYRGPRILDNTSENLHARFLSGSLHADKSEMWRAPTEILGKYCCLDAEATYLLYTQILLPVLRKFPLLQEYHEKYFLHLIRVHIEQKILGIEMDVAGLEARRLEVEKQISLHKSMFLIHPETSTHIRAIESELLQELAQKEPPRYLKLKSMPAEPPKYRKNGDISKNWLKWEENREKYTKPIQSKNWENWNEKYEAACAGHLTEYKFNPQSGPQLRDLLYNRLGYPVRMRSETGEPQVSIRALKQMGQIGSLLTDHAYARKEMGFLEDYLDRTRTRSTIHPDFRLPGTCTGRLSSKNPNFQQIPKSKAMMSLFRARPGHVWVDLDFSALEAVVATEFSQDPNMLLLYADGAVPNDIHLFVAAHVPGLRETVLASGYTPVNPSREGLAAAKKQAKRERGIAKTVVYACQYGAGVDKVHSTLEADGVDISREEVETVHGTYWKLFDGIRQFGKKLEYQWRDNGGYVLNGIGRPMCVLEDYRKDLLNRFIQSTGHDILVRYIYILTHKLTEAAIPWQPLIIDLHDAATVEVPEQYAERVVEVFRWSMDQLNAELQGSIQLRGVPTVGRTLAEVKEPEE